jgi:O-6-methylguanine DNA methyltransferase
MTHYDQQPLTEARTLVYDLRALGRLTAPATLRDAILAAIQPGEAYFPLDTPVGTAYVAYNDRGITVVMRAATPADFEERFRALTGRTAVAAAAPPVGLRRAVERQLHGERQRQLRFDLRDLSEFERAVLLKAFEIPFGEVRPYAWVAREIGHPKAVRAVGTALANNPVPLIIPCHRVVRSDGHLGRYSLGGDEYKRVVLAAEGVNPDAVESLARGGVRYFGSDTTHIFCFPTCRHARRTTPSHLMRFGSEAEARAAGYRPCKVCRPAALEA